MWILFIIFVLPAIAYVLAMGGALGVIFKNRDAFKKGNRRNYNNRVRSYKSDDESGSYADDDDYDYRYDEEDPYHDWYSHDSQDWFPQEEEPYRSPYPELNPHDDPRIDEYFDFK